MARGLQRTTALFLAVLVLAEGIPREVCACVDAECRVECNARSLDFLAKPADREQPRCCCCQHGAAEPTAESRDDVPSCSGCPCPMVVRQSEMPLGPQSIQLDAVPTSYWHGGLAMGLVQQDESVAGQETVWQLAPDDPVSLAQILRI